MFEAAFFLLKGAVGIAVIVLGAAIALGALFGAFEWLKNTLPDWLYTAIMQVIALIVFVSLLAATVGGLYWGASKVFG